jgi:hypothetical protein
MIECAPEDQIKSNLPTLTKLISAIPEVTPENLGLALQLSKVTKKPLSQFIPDWKKSITAPQTLSNIAGVLKVRPSLPVTSNSV